MYGFPTLASNSATYDLNAEGYIAQEGQTSAGQKTISTLYNSLDGYKKAIVLVPEPSDEALDTATDQFFSGQRTQITAILNNILGLSAYNIKFEMGVKPE